MLTIIDQLDRHAEQRETVIRGLNSLASMSSESDPTFFDLMEVASLAAKSCATHSSLEQVLRKVIAVSKCMSVTDFANGQLTDILQLVESWKLAS